MEELGDHLMWRMKSRAVLKSAPGAYTATDTGPLQRETKKIKNVIGTWHLQYQGGEVFEEGDGGMGGQSHTGEATKLTPSHCQHYPHGRYHQSLCMKILTKICIFTEFGFTLPPPILTEWLRKVNHQSCSPLSVCSDNLFEEEEEKHVGCLIAKKWNWVLR